MSEQLENTFLLNLKTSFEKNKEAYYYAIAFILLVIAISIYFAIASDSYVSKFTAAETTANVVMNKNTLYMVSSRNPDLTVDDTTDLTQTAVNKVATLNALMQNVTNGASIVKTSLSNLYGYTLILDPSITNQTLTINATTKGLTGSANALNDLAFDNDVVKIFFNGKSETIDSTMTTTEIKQTIYDIVASNYF